MGLVAYFDAASTEPLHPQAREALLAALDVGWADPARLYGQARRAHLLLEQARTEVAEALGARPDEVVLHLIGHAGGASRRARHPARAAAGRAATW